jgi:hypothetical protein
LFSDVWLVKCSWHMLPFSWIELFYHVYFALKGWNCEAK